MRYLFLCVIMALTIFSCQDEGPNSSIDPETGKVISKPKEKPAQVMAQPTGEPTAIDSRYRLIDFVAGDAEVHLDTLEIIAQFKEGVLTGTGGCNMYNASFALEEGNKLKVGPIKSTRKMCKGLLGKEKKYFEVLEGATSYERPNAQTLRILSEKGALTFVLQDK